MLAPTHKLESKTNPSIAVPVRMTLRAPNQSISRPINGTHVAHTRPCNVKASEIAARPTWKYCLRGLKKTPKDKTTICQS